MATVASAPVSTASPAPRRRGARRAGVLWAVVVLAATLYVVLALVMPLPVYYVDEGLYQHLARSLADGQGFWWRGEPIELRSALYVYLITPPWMVASGTQAYDIAKVETALLSCLVAVPVWMLARRVMPQGPALLAVTLALAGTWMVTGQLVTESIGLPLATASLCLLVGALRRPQARLSWFALALALLAAWARIQLVALVPVIFGALLLDVLRSGSAWRARARLHRAPLLLIGTVLGVAVAAVAFAGPTITGRYSGILHFHPPLSDVVRMSGIEALQLTALCGFLPTALLAILAVQRSAWRDDVIGPLLAVLLPAAVVLAVQNGYYVSGVEGLWSIQRYMIYVGPLLLVFTVAAFTRGGLVGPRTLVAAGLVSALLLAMPEVAERSEQRAAFATAERVRDLVPSASAGVAMLVVALGVTLVALAASVTDRRLGRASAPVVVGLSLLIVLAVQSATVFVWQLGVERESRRLMPDDLAWIDHHSHGPVAVLEVTNNAFEFPLLDFFNGNIQQYYASQSPVTGAMLQGGLCAWRIGRAGVLEFPQGCPLRTDELLINDPMAHLRFHREVSTASERHVGRIVRVSGAPRLKSLVLMPCNRALPPAEPVTLRPLTDQPIPCSPTLSGTTWLDRPGTLHVGIDGAPVIDHVATVGGKRYRIAANRHVDIPIPVPAARRGEFRVDLDWTQQSPLDPSVVRVELEQAGRRESLL